MRQNKEAVVAVMARPTHTPALLAEVVDALHPALGVGSTLLDATVGLGGHSFALLEACPGARLVGIDRDGDALALAQERLAAFDVTLVRARFDELGTVLDDLGIDCVQAMLFDLGLSSLQIDEAGRGFAYTQDGPLDMRMDDRLAVTAADIVNTWPDTDLARVIRDFGEEPHALRVAQAIVAARQQRPIQTTGQLADVVTAAMPAAVRYGSGGHPAKRVFQALRICTNDELTALAQALPEALARLGVGGRLAVISYHSLEDRLVKQAFRAATTSQAPRRLPVVPESLQPRFALVSDQAIRPSQDEVDANPRAASARMRVITRVREDAK
ncbi:MAG: 16S rRNA (cytosine(1402)-N(4))-methyltransferase RsmH [Propionibacteriaceae bacterium]|nr:16S rRNA (cytosine(1402)-N(4))-methyltransferase RsmH [Propionibacteriaceae bacterium]